jgi:hypothetical protein
LLFAPCEVLIPILMKFTLSFLFWTYFSDNSIIKVTVILLFTFQEQPYQIPAFPQSCHAVYAIPQARVQYAVTADPSMWNNPNPNAHSPL